MYTDDEELEGLPPAEAYRRAKVEHFLQHVREYVEMGRYLAARKTLETVLSLDRENEEAKNHCQFVDDFLAKALHRNQNGHSGNNGGSNGPLKQRRSELVMIVDQDERLLVSLTGTLRRYGFMAIAASSYDEAVESYAMVKPEVVISEVNFDTGPRGFDLYLWLKTNSGNEDLPFLFLATRIDRDTLIAGKRFGVDDLILKPVDDDVVIASVINSLSRRKTMPVHT